MIEILEHGTIEILGVVHGDLLRNSVVTYDVLPEKFLDGGRGYISYWSHFEGVVCLCWSKFVHDIDAPLLQGPQWSYQL
jgi:hypothetical protein